MVPLKNLLDKIPEVLTASLNEEYQKLHREFFLGHWEPHQLDGGRFAEVVLRIVEYKSDSVFTPLGSQIDRNRIVAAAEQNTLLPDSLRIQIPRMATLLLDFRNARNVAHVSPIDVNEMDSTFVLSGANWLVAELIRLETGVPPEEAQAVIKTIIERKIPIIESFGSRMKVLDTRLSAKHKILTLCYQKFPERVSDQDLLDWTEYDTHNSGRFRRILGSLNKESLIDYRDDGVVLTRKGVRWVEDNIRFEL